MITIQNFTKRTLVFNLPHAEACSETVCTCSRVKAGVVDHDKATGERTVRAVNQRLAHAITLFPRGTKGDKGAPLDVVSNLLDGVARVPDVKHAQMRREIAITSVVPPAPEPSPESPPTPGPTSPTFTAPHATPAADAAMKE